MDVLQQENEALKAENEQLKQTIMGLRFGSKIPDLPDAFARQQEALAKDPAAGDRVKVVAAGSRYHHKDFASTFEDHKVSFIEDVKQDCFGTVLAVSEHFKRKGTQVYLVKFDTGGAAVMARKGIEQALWVGAHVSIVSAGSKYAAKDFRARFTQHNIVDECRKDAPGVILLSQPHYKNPSTLVHLVAIDAKLNCVVMNGKGIVPRDVPGLKEFAARKKREEAAAAAAAAAAADSEKEGAEKRPADEAAADEPEAKRARGEEKPEAEAAAEAEA